jgi:hypothetical protein
MNREIKFRAWNKKTNQWQHEMGCDILGEIILLGAWMNGVSIRDLNEIVVMQYTGMKDCNGKEIYEGDLIRHPDFIPSANILPVEFRYGCWCLGAWDCLRTHFERGEIAGNIYENPTMANCTELLF